MRRLVPVLFLFATVLVNGPAAQAQDVNDAPPTPLAQQSVTDERQQLMQKQVIAEWILTREETAAGREFDGPFREAARRNLAGLALEALQQLQTESRGISPMALGESQEDLVYTPVTPCRIIDTRLAGGTIAANETRDFKVTGSNYSPQGGSATSCGVPFGPATAVVVNFTAVAPAGPGNFGVTPFGTAMPLASIINYSNVNIANGVAIAICNPATTTCISDISIIARVNAAHLVADIQGYFRSATGLGGSAQAQSTSVSLNGGACQNVTSVTLTNTSGSSRGVVCRADAQVQLDHSSAVADSAHIYITDLNGNTCSQTESTPGHAMVEIPAAIPVIACCWDFSLSASRRFILSAGLGRTYYLNAIAPGSTSTADLIAPGSTLICSLE